MISFGIFVLESLTRYQINLYMHTIGHAAD